MTTASLPRVPEGLRDLMKVYTKEVLREKPSDLYEFSAKFFNMIVGEKSHQAVRKYEPAQTYETIMKNRIRQQVPISMVFNIIPENLTDLIKQFIKAVLREKPDNIYIFAQEYFQRLSKEKSGRTEYKKYATYENSLKDKENLGPVAKVTCECGRVLSAKAKDVENNTVLIEKEEKESLIMALPKKDDDAKNVINMTYIRSVVIIQRHFRRYLKRVKTDRNKKDKCNSMEYMTSILLLQRQFRRLNAKKRVKKLKLSRLNEPKGKVDTANYMKAVLIIQKHYRLYLKQKQEQNRLENDKVSLATAAIIIQRAFRRMLAVHKARRITSASADHPEDLNDNASETGSYTSVSTALLSTESTELGGTNYEERVHQKIIHEDEEVENSNVDGGLEKEYFAEPIKSDKKSIHLRKSDTLSGPLIDNQEDHENNEYSEFEVKKQKEEIEDEFRAIKKRDTEIQAIPEHTLERQDELQSKKENESVDVADLDIIDSVKALDYKKENDIVLETKTKANLESQPSIENLKSKKEKKTENKETNIDLEPIMTAEIKATNISNELKETEYEKNLKSESQNGGKEDKEKENSNKIPRDSFEGLENVDNIKINETIPPPKVIKSESQLQATPTISIEHVDDSPEENSSIPSESNDVVAESAEPSLICAAELPERVSEIDIESRKTSQDTKPNNKATKEGHDQESPKQPSIDNDKEKPVESLVSNTSRDKHDQESLKQASVDNDKEEPVESLASKACKDGKHSIDDDMEKRVESLVSNTSRDKHDQESLKHTSVDNDKEEPVESLASKACKDGQPSIDDDMEKRVESLVSSTSWDKHDQESLKHTSVDNDKEEPVESLASKACKDGQPSIDDDMEKRVESLVSNASQEEHNQESPKQSSIDTDLEKPIESLNSNSSQEGHDQESPKKHTTDNDLEKPDKSLVLNASQEEHDQESLKQPSIDTDLEKPIESLNSNASQERHDQESPKQILIDNDPEKPVESLVSNFTQEIQSTEDTSSKDDEKDTVTDPIYRAKRSLEEIETNLDKIMENSKGIGEETKGDEFVEKEVSLKNSNDQIDPDKVKEISYEKREEKQEIEQLGNSERDTDTGKDSIENEEKLLTLGDEVEEIKTLGDDIKNDTSETISGIREAISGSTDAIEVSDEKLLKKQSSNEVINELENNEKEHKADPNDKEVVLEGSHSRSQQSPEKNKIDVDSDNNSKNISEETKIQNALIEEGDYEPLLLSGEKVEGKPTTEGSLESETGISTELVESLKRGIGNKLLESLEIEANKDHPVDHLANKDEILIPTKSQEELLHNQESASTDDEIKPVAATDLKEDLVQISLNAVEDSVFAIAHMKDKNSLENGIEKSEIVKKFIVDELPIGSLNEKQLTKSVEKLTLSTSQDELKPKNNISLKESETGTDELIEEKNIDQSAMEKEVVKEENGHFIETDTADITEDTIKNKQKTNSEKRSLNEMTDSLRNVTEEKEFDPEDKESEKKVAAIETFSSADITDSPPESTDKHTVSRGSKNSGDSSFSPEDKPEDAKLDDDVTISKDGESGLKITSKESINKTNTESDSGNGQEKELSENDSKIKTKELTNLDDVDIKETQTSNGVPSASDEKDVPDSKAEKIDSIPSKTEKNSSLLVSNQLIGTQNLPTNPIEIEKNTKKYSSVNVKDKDIGTLSSGRLVPTPIAELQLKSFKNTNDDGAWYDIYVENQIPIDTDSGKTTDSVQSIQIDADRPGEIIEEPIIPQERVPSYYTPQKIVEPEIPKVKNSVSFFVSFDSDDGKPKYKIPKKFQNQSKTNIPEKSQLKAYSDSTKPGEIETSTADDNENEEEIEVIEVSEGDPEYQQMAGTKLQTILELNENEQPSDLQNEGNEAVDPETGEMSSVVKSKLRNSKEANEELENPLPTTKKSDYDFETIYKADILSLTKSVQIIERAFKRFKNKSQEVPENQNVEIDEAKANNAAQVIQKWIRNILIKKSSKLSSDIVEDNHKILAPRKIQRAYRNYVEKLKNENTNNKELLDIPTVEIENNYLLEIENEEKDSQKIEKHNNAVLIIQKAFRLYSQRNKAKQNKMKSDENDVRQNDAATKIQRTFKRYLKLIKNPDVVIQNQSKKIEEVQESVNSNIVTTQEPIPEPNNAPKDDLKLEAKAVLIIQRAFRQYLERKKLETLEENSFDSQSITSSRITTIENVNYPTDATPTDSLVQESVENTPEIKPKSEWYVGSTRIIPSQEVVGEPLEINQELAASARKSTQVVESIETVDSSHGSLESKLNSGTKFDEIVGKDIEKDNALSCGLAGPEDAVEAESGSNEDDILLTQSNLDKIERDILSTQELVNNFLEKEIEFSSAQGPYENSSPEEVVEETCIKKSASLVNISETETGDPTDSSLSETTGLDTLSADTIDKATVKLAKPEEVIEKMSQLRESRSQTSQERIQSGDASFEESVVRPMSSLQEQSSLDIEDGDIIVYNRLQRDETRESSAQSDSVVFGDPETEKIVEKDEESGRVHLMRHYTIAGDDPRGLFRSVTIDDALNYEEDMDSGHGIKSTASFYLDDETSENIRKKMMAYSLSETDSDYIDPRKVSQEDFDVDTAMADAMGTSTETESTIVSAATKIQAGARGFLTRRRLRRASAGTKSSTQDTKASFGNDAISESLERFIEEEAAKKIQAAYRIHTRKRKGYPRKMEGISLESNLAARRQKLQRGDALRNDSTPDDEHSVATNGGQTQKVAKPPRHKLVGDAKSRAAMELKWLTMRQNSMPVQIDCEVFRVIPKHMRKRIKSADANKRK